MTLVLLPPSTDDELDEKKVLTGGNGPAMAHWRRAHCGLSRMQGGRQPLSCDRLDERTCVRGQRGEVKNTWAITMKRKTPHAYLQRSFVSMYSAMTTLILGDWFWVT